MSPSVHRHPTNGCVIVRSSQPQVGVLGIWRCPEDEKLLMAISHACAPTHHDSLPTQTVYQNGGPHVQLIKEAISNGGPGWLSTVVTVHFLYRYHLRKLHTHTPIRTHPSATPIRTRQSARTHLHTPIYTPICTHHLHTPIRMHPSAHTHPHAPICTHPSTCTHLHAHTHMHPSAHTHPHAPICMHALTGKPVQNGQVLFESDEEVEERREEEEEEKEMPKLLVMDLRSYTAALGNRAKGGGCECQGEMVCSVLGSSK